MGKISSTKIEERAKGCPTCGRKWCYYCVHTFPSERIGEKFTTSDEYLPLCDACRSQVKGWAGRLAPDHSITIADYVREANRIARACRFCRHFRLLLNIRSIRKQLKTIRLFRVWTDLWWRSVVETEREEAPHWFLEEYGRQRHDDIMSRCPVCWKQYCERGGRVEELSELISPGGSSAREEYGVIDPAHLDAVFGDDPQLRRDLKLWCLVCFADHLNSWCKYFAILRRSDYLVSGCIVSSQLFPESGSSGLDVCERGLPLAFRADSVHESRVVLLDNGVSIARVENSIARRLALELDKGILWTATVMRKPQVTDIQAVDQARAILEDLRYLPVRSTLMLKTRRAARRDGLSMKQRWWILERDGFACVYCGRQARNGFVYLTVDHVLPKSRDGGDEEENLVTVCVPCNAGKLARLIPGDLLDRFLAQVRERTEAKRAADAEQEEADLQERMEHYYS